MKVMYKVVRSLIKGLMYVGVGLLLVIESYLTGLWLTSSVFAVACAVCSFVAPLPALIAQHFGVLLLLASTPIAVIILIYLIVKMSKKEKKPEND